MSTDKKKKSTNNPIGFYLIILPIFTAISLVIAKFAVDYFDNAGKVKRAYANFGEFSGVFVGLLLFQLISMAVGMIVGNERFHAQVENPDQYVYSTKGKEQVLLVNDDTALGRFNRAQRGFNNMLETLPLILVQYLVACAIAPRTANVAVLVYGVGRVLFSLGYVRSAGSRQLGLMIARMFGSAVFESIIIVCALEANGLLSRLPSFFVPHAFQQ